MKYSMTSAEASKLLKKLLEQKSILLSEERRSSVFNAALGGRCGIGEAGV